MELLGQRHLHAVEDRAPEISQPHVFLDDVTLVLDSQTRTASEHRGQVMVVVSVDRTAAAAVGDQRVVVARVGERKTVIRFATQKHIRRRGQECGERDIRATRETQ